MTRAANIAPADKLPSAVPLQVSIPFMLGSISLATSYGSSFFLVDALRSIGQSATTAGAVISTGTIATILCSLLVGRIADSVGLTRTISAAAVMMTIAMACFASASTSTRFAYAGGFFLGVGWSGFYMLAPLEVLRHVRSEARIKYLTLLSGSQMLGIGLAAPLARAVAETAGSYIAVYALFAAACLVAATVFELAGRRGAHASQPRMPNVGLTLQGVMEIFRSSTRYPIIMIGVGGCVFAGLFTFQTLYAASRAQSADTFFLVFTLTAVFMRFAVAPIIGKVRIERAVAVLFMCTIGGTVDPFRQCRQYSDLHHRNNGVRAGIRSKLFDAEQHGRRSCRPGWDPPGHCVSGIHALLLRRLIRISEHRGTNREGQQLRSSSDEHDDACRRQCRNSYDTGVLGRPGALTSFLRRITGCPSKAITMT
ncbi:MFS family permease [Bradyrhizobium sp. USDA 4502]